MPVGASATRHRDFLAQHGGREIARRRIDHDTLAQRDGVEFGAVGAQRIFVIGAAIDVVEQRLGDALARQHAQNLQLW